VPEEKLHWFRRGLRGLVTPTAYPDLKLDGTVDKVERVPLSPGKFSATVKVKARDLEESLVPGLAVSAKFVPYLKEKALTVPTKAVFTDDRNLRRKYVYLAVEKGKPKKRPVEVGQTSGDNVEILEGLEEGDKVLLEKPKDGK